MSDFINIDNERDEDLIQKLRAYDITKEPELAVEVCEELLDKVPEEEKIINDRMRFEPLNYRAEER